MPPSTAVPTTGAAGPKPNGLAATWAKLWPYIWPHGRTDLQRRVFLAFGLLLVAKGVTMVTPFAFKWATDALVAVPGGNPGAQAGATAGSRLSEAPILLSAAYGVTRIPLALLTHKWASPFA